MSDPLELDDENLLSPDTEVATEISAQALLNVQSTGDMESILLETSQLDETGTDDDLDQPTDESQQRDLPEEMSPDPHDKVPQSTNSLQTPSTSDETPSDAPHSVDKEVLLPTESIEVEVQNLNIGSSEEVKEKRKDSAGDLSKYFTTQTSNDPFDGLGGKDKTDSAMASDPEQQNTERAQTRTIRIRSNSESVTEEAVPVKFEESKGKGLKFTQSTKNLSKYFEESPTESDTEGKEFFDTFAAAENTSTAPITIPTTSVHNSTSGSLPPQTPPIGSLPTQTPPLSSLPPQTPPIPSGDMTLSPLHRLTPSVTSQTSQEEAAVTSSIEASFQDSEDTFFASLQSSDADRRHDAWIPSEMTRQTLVAMVTSQPGTYFPESTHLTMPGIVMDESLGDPVRELVVRFMGETAAAKRQTLTVDSVPQNEEGLRQLVAAECYRAAVDLTGPLLTACGQGAGKLNQVTRHTPQTLQLWQARLCLMVKLRLYSHAEAECQAFGTLDKPDLYYDFYPDLYPGRRGSMVSFDMRVLHAELPQYLGKTQESLDRLHYLLAIVKKIESNLNAGLAEDGSILELSNSSRQASRELWRSREIRLLYSIGNCLLHIKDFSTALDVFMQLISLDTDHQMALYSGIGRIYLQMGDIKTAKVYFDKAEQKEDQNKDAAARIAINKGFVSLGENRFSDAHSQFQQAVQLDPTNTVAVNNMAVCSLYEGKLKDSLSLLETLVHSHPETYLQEGVLFNLCTLYELESSRAMAKKQSLLELVSQYKGNGFNVACLKMV